MEAAYNTAHRKARTGSCTLDVLGSDVLMPAMRTLLAIVPVCLALVAAVWLVAPSVLTARGDMRAPRSEIHAAVLDGAIYTAGGIGFYRTLDSCERFAVATREWEECPDLPRALHHVAMAAGDGRVFASGGYRSLPFDIDDDAALYAYTPGGNRWETIALLPHPLGQHSMHYEDDMLWLVGGDDSAQTLPTLWRYDLDQGRWGSWSRMAPMRHARHSHASATGEGALYVTGGRSDIFGTQSASVERYDFAQDSWTDLPDMPVPLAGHAAAVLDGRLHVYGGENLAEGTVFAAHYILDLRTLQWTRGPDLPHARHGFAGAAVAGQLWALGGGRKHGMWTPLTVSGTAQSIRVE